jgi:hypothetical protein
MEGVFRLGTRSTYLEISIPDYHHYPQYILAMFGNNAFGALGVDQNQAGPSRKQVQGEEIDVDVSPPPDIKDAS